MATIFFTGKSYYNGAWPGMLATAPITLIENFTFVAGQGYNENGTSPYAYLNGYDGSKLAWSKAYPLQPGGDYPMFTSQCISIDGKLLVAGGDIKIDGIYPSSDPNVHAPYLEKVDPQSGKTIWQSYLSSDDIWAVCSAILTQGNKIYVQVTDGSGLGQGTYIKVVDNNTGTVIDTISLTTGASSSTWSSQLKALDDGSILSAIIDSSSHLNIQKIHDGIPDSRYTINSIPNVISCLALSNGIVYAVSNVGEHGLIITKIDSSTNSTLSSETLDFGTGANTTALTLGNNLDNNGNLTIAFTANNSINGLSGFGLNDIALIKISTTDFSLVSTTIVGTPGADDLYGASNSISIMGSDIYLNMITNGLPSSYNPFCESKLQINSSDQTSFNQIVLGTDGMSGYGIGYTYTGTDGSDYIETTQDSDVVFGKYGNDTIWTYDGNDEIYGDYGADRINSGAGNDEVYGSYGKDEIYGDEGDDLLYGEQGNDKIYGGDGDDVLDGGIGADYLSGGLGDDIYYIDDKNDVIDDKGDPSENNTVILTKTISFRLPTGVINASISGNDSGATLTGNAAGNELSGNDGKNTLDGGAGADVLSGGGGNDVIYGGLGADELQGGSGRDTFKFTSTSDLNKQVIISDVIVDFSSSQKDLIDLSIIDANIKAVGNQAFNFATKATANSVWFNSSVGVLYGDNSGDKIADFSIALMGVSKLAATDFVL